MCTWKQLQTSQLVSRAMQIWIEANSYSLLVLVLPNYISTDQKSKEEIG